MLHCGAFGVERNELARIPTPPPTDTWHPVGHETFVNLVQDKLDDVGFAFGKEAHGVYADGSKYFGVVELMNGTKPDQDHALVLGLRNSTDRSVSAGIAFGSQVFVCDNLAFSGEITVTRRHTKYIMDQLPDLIAAAVERTPYMRDAQTARFETYRETRLKTRRADHLIMNMYRNGVIPPTKIRTVAEQWDKPEHDFGPRSVWRLFNAATEALKGTALPQRPRRTIALQLLLDKAADFEIPAPIRDTAEEGELVLN
jgi:hypothetical protein